MSGSEKKKKKDNKKTTDKIEFQLNAMEECMIFCGLINRHKRKNKHTARQREQRMFFSNNIVKQGKE